MKEEARRLLDFAFFLEPCKDPFCYSWHTAERGVFHLYGKYARYCYGGQEVSKRDEMLGRIRQALGRLPESRATVPSSGAGLPELGDVLPPIQPAELVAKFEEELEKVAGCAHRAATLQELEETLRRLLAASAGDTVVVSRNPLLAQLGLEQRLRAWGKNVAVWPGEGGREGTPEEAQRFREHALSAGVGITGVDFVLAESGTLVLSSATEGAHLASLAPPVHVALYRRGQLLGSLEELLERLAVPRDPNEPIHGRSVVFITGPSRTADIEQILIRGVHGPRELHAILVEESCLA
jgi:L-lactate dehydrogenase complex protein LldG